MKRRNFISQLSSIGVCAFGFMNVNFVPYSAESYKRGSIFGEEEEFMMLSVKVIKDKAQFCSTSPHIEFLSDNWFFDPALDHHGDFYGENLREVYFNIQSRAIHFTPATLKIHIPGVHAARVIVGHTDVPFEQMGNTVIFDLINDPSRGQLMQLMYQNPWGGYPIAFIHNWEIRKAKEYALEAFPTAKFASVHNYLLAAQEVLRQMRNMGPGLPKPFRGEIVLMGSEVAATRGHMDYPPHIHIMHYEFGKEVNGVKEWKSRLVPHFYMDDFGNITRNKYEIIVGKGERSKEIGPGESAQFKDSVGEPVLDLIIMDKGELMLKHPDGRAYSLKPDPKQGAPGAVWGYFRNKAICRSSVRDYPDIGAFRIRLEQLDNGEIIKTLNDGYVYDPFIARKYYDLYAAK